MALRIKLYVQPDNEIRMFTLGSSEGFAQLRQRVRDLVNRSNFQLYWIDLEGDKVICGSDEELKEARCTKTTSPLRMVVGPAKAEAGKPVHPHVICDGCDGKIVGTRFKCLQCVDYDLCESCEHNGKHLEHSMIAIRGVLVNDRAKPCGPRFGRGRCQGPQGTFPEQHKPHIPPFPLRGPFFTGNMGTDLDLNKPLFDLIAETSEKVRQFFEQEIKETSSEPSKEKKPMDDNEKTQKREETPTAAEIPEEKQVAETVFQRPESPAPSETEAEWTKVQAESMEESKPVPDKQSNNEGGNKINHALRAMEEMGFPKESVLLRRLLQNYNGDISRVLDSLK